MDFGRARDEAASVALRAGQFIRSQEGHHDAFDTSEKGRNDFVTAVDHGAQERIIEGLKTAFPAVPVLAEETEDGVLDRLPSDGALWIVDPVDGTTNFMHGIPPYAVSIALAVEGEVQVGVVLEITHARLYTAVRGQGAYMNGRRLSVSSTRSHAEALVATGFPYSRFDHLDEFMAVFRTLLTEVRGIRRHGAAAVDLARVAAGNFDVFYESGLKPWDVAAGLLLVQEAGGRATDFRDRSGPVTGGQMLATNGYLHAEMLQFMEPMLET